MALPVSCHLAPVCQSQTNPLAENLQRTQQGHTRLVFGECGVSVDSKRIWGQGNMDHWIFAASMTFMNNFLAIAAGKGSPVMLDLDSPPILLVLCSSTHIAYLAIAN